MNTNISVALIVAVAENGVIGQGDAIPWRLKSDMQRFKALTLGKPIVMGRKTYESLPRRPLPGRTNIVITRNPDYQAPAAVVATSFTAARELAIGDALRRSATEIAVIGGAQIYAQWMAVADRLEITEVHDKPEGDTFFPAIDPAQWEEVARSPQARAESDLADFSYVTYKRRSQSPRAI